MNLMEYFGLLGQWVIVSWGGLVEIIVDGMQQLRQLFTAPQQLEADFWSSYQGTYLKPVGSYETDPFPDPAAFWDAEDEQIYQEIKDNIRLTTVTSPTGSHVIELDRTQLGIGFTPLEADENPGGGITFHHVSMNEVSLLPRRGMLISTHTTEMPGIPDFYDGLFRCQYCHGITNNDERGNCLACGAPRA